MNQNYGIKARVREMIREADEREKENFPLIVFRAFLPLLESPHWRSNCSCFNPETILVFWGRQEETESEHNSLLS